MLEEAYVSFETAKLLKDKGFDDISSIMYKENGEICINPKSVVSWRLKCWYPCLTQQMAMAWLRKVYNIHIELNWDKGNQLYSFQIWKPEKYQPEISSLDLWRIYKDDSYPGEWNYEEACEIAIKYCLENLI